MNMLMNVKMAWREYLRERVFTGLNLLSLVIGLAVAYASIHYIYFELSYDGFHRHAPSTYRLVRTYRSQDYGIVGFRNWDGASPENQKRQLEALKTATGVVDAAQFIVSAEAVYVEANGRKVQASNVLTTNTPAAFCSIFTWQLRQGSFQDFAAGTNKVMLTERLARRLFGDDLAGSAQQVLQIGNDRYAIAAVIADIPLNSHIDFELAVSRPALAYWGSRVYLQTEPNADVPAVTRAVNAALEAFNPALASDELYKAHALQPLADIHFQQDVLYELKPPGNPLYLFLIGCFAGCIALITLFNYANLSLAIKLKRRKSVGIQKAMGASGLVIAKQFWVEGVLLSLLAAPIAALLLWWGIPAFNALMQTNIPASVFEGPQAFLLLAGLALLLGTLASLASIVKLSPRRALSLFVHSTHQARQFTVPGRTYLLVSQFVLLIGITSISYFVARQIEYVENKDLGFRQRGLLYAYTSPEAQDAFQERLKQLPGVIAVGNGSSFGIEPFNQGTYKFEGSDIVYDDASQVYLDPGALQAYGLRMLAPAVAAGDTAQAVYTLINRTAAEKLAAQKQIPLESVVGQTIITEPEYIDENQRAGFPFVVAGIFEDINLFSLHQKVEPYFVTVAKNLRMDGRTIVQYDPARTPRVLTDIRAAYDALGQPNPLEIDFLEEQVALLYQQDRRMADLLACFNAIALLLAGIGTLGITLFLTIARTKEIGIRKVLGASVGAIIRSATREYVYFIGIALLISFPVAYYVVQQWLAGFAYRIDIQPAAFIVVGLFTLLFAAALVGAVAWRAALANPVKSLKND